MFGLQEGQTLRWSVPALYCCPRTGFLKALTTHPHLVRNGLYARPRDQPVDGRWPAYEFHICLTGLTDVRWPRYAPSRALERSRTQWRIPGTSCSVHHHQAFRMHAHAYLLTWQVRPQGRKKPVMVSRALVSGQSIRIRSRRRSLLRWRSVEHCSGASLAAGHTTRASRDSGGYSSVSPGIPDSRGYCGHSHVPGVPSTRRFCACWGEAERGVGWARCGRPLIAGDLQRLNDLSEGGTLGFREEEVNMFRHDNEAVDAGVVFSARMF